MTQYRWAFVLALLLAATAGAACTRDQIRNSNPTVGELLYGPAPPKPSRPAPDGAGRGATSPADEELAFMDLAHGWEVEARDESDHTIARLVRPARPGVSAIVSRDPLRESSPKALDEELRSIHAEAIAALPSTFLTKERKEWSSGGRTHVVTSLRGAHPRSGEETVVRAISVRVADQAYTIFAMFPRTDAELAIEIDEMAGTLRHPKPRAEPDEQLPSIKK